jgi:hypothetical protein
MLGQTGTRSTAPQGELVYTGTPEVSLERAVLPYTEIDGPSLGGRLEDLGMGVVLDGTDPAHAVVMDLGSGGLRRTDLSGPVVLFGWLYRGVVEALADGGTSWSRALRLLERTGFTPLTRPLYLRVGFRDMVEDLDFHEELAIRITLPGGVARIHLDYDDAILHIRTGSSERNGLLERTLTEAFAGQPIHRSSSGSGVGAQSYEVVLPMARTPGELRLELRRLRRGVLHLLQRFEPARWEAVREALSGFGERDSLRHLEVRRGAGRSWVRGASRTGISLPIASGRVH